MRWISKAKRQLRNSALHPTEKENNAFPQLHWPSKPWNSGAEKLISEDQAVPVNWVKVSQVLPLWVNSKEDGSAPQVQNKGQEGMSIYVYIFCHLFSSFILVCYSFVCALLKMTVFFFIVTIKYSHSSRLYIKCKEEEEEGEETT